MGDCLRKVQPGESINGRLSASAWNSMLDVVAVFQNSRHDTAGGSRPVSRDGATVKLRNDTGEAVARFAVLGLGEPIFPPDDDEGVKSFTNCPAFAGVTPEEDVHEGRFAIALEPASGRPEPPPEGMVEAETNEAPSVQPRACVPSSLAGARSLPLHAMRDAFWARFRQAA